MPYKKSRFNYSYKRAPGEYVIYNTYSKALLLLTSKEMDSYESLSFERQEDIDTLIDNQILIDEDFDEVGFLRYCHYKTKFQHETLNLIIATSLDCNFGCPYCYENRRVGKMGADVQDAIVRYAEDCISHGVKNLEITWYGGEPLLYPDIIERLGNKLILLADKHGCTLNMYMVTNGYLLTPAIIDLLDELGVSRVQITLDGLEANHNCRRHLRNGKGTFDVIFKNLELFSDSPIHVDIRMNVDHQNCVDYPDLARKIRSLGNPNITLYPSPVENINKDKINTISQYMTTKEFEQFSSDLFLHGEEMPAAAKVLDDRYCFCNAETENCFVVDENGQCYKCWDQVGRQQYSCFNVLEPEKRNYKNIVSFIGWDPLADERCGDCVFLPICFGGCKFYKMQNINTDCGFSDASLQAYIEATFFKT